MTQDAEHPDAANETIRKFGYPDTLLANYEHWVVLLRPQQVTLGSLVLACREQATRFSDISPHAFADLATAIGDIEAVLSQTFSYNKINYLMLMMVDPHVHFHVIPRYAEAKEFGGVTFADAGWPGVPDLGVPTALDQVQIAALADFLRRRWPAG
jgi:diadenosine tetraphosphate (Ap4A) HIT family hydrolase